jgi:hypothetical protein
LISRAFHLDVLTSLGKNHFLNNLLDGVIAPGMKRVALQYPATNQPGCFQQTIFFKGLDCIGGTRRRKAAV